MGKIFCETKGKNLQRCAATQNGAVSCDAYLDRGKLVGWGAGAMSRGWTDWGAEHADGRCTFNLVVLPAKSDKRP